MAIKETGTLRKEGRSAERNMCNGYVHKLNDVSDKRSQVEKSKKEEGKVKSEKGKKKNK